MPKPRGNFIRVEVLLTNDEYEDISRKARSAGLGLSAFIRLALRHTDHPALEETIRQAA